MKGNLPILVLQMQRMGDLILTFPLLLWLERTYPGHEIFVVADRRFAVPLQHIAPRAVYVAWENVGRLKGRNWHMVLNLSIRDEAALFARQAQSDVHFGPLLDEQGNRFVKGDWQLYRSSIVALNRHNRFHWADLNALDVIPLSLMKTTRWSAPRILPRENRTVGLFLGASEAAKRPDAEFWAKLVQALRKRGLKPVLYGGPAEAELGNEVVRIAGKPLHSFCAKLSITELSVSLQAIQVLITPDTGPMHLAAWGGARTLNLSMGPVSAYDTGPYQLGHHVLRFSGSCVNCWKCDRDRFYCKDSFDVNRIAMLVSQMVTRPDYDYSRLKFPGQRLFSTGRNSQGLYDLLPLGKEEGSRGLIGKFWQVFFGARFGLWHESEAVNAYNGLAESQPRLAATLGVHLPRLVSSFAQGMNRGFPHDYLDRTIPFFRPCVSYLQLLLQNNDFSRSSKTEALAHLESLTVAMNRK